MIYVAVAVAAVGSGYEEDPVGELPGDLRDDAEECGPRVPVHDGRAGHGGVYRW